MNNDETPQRITRSDLPGARVNDRTKHFPTFATWMREEPGTWFLIEEGSDYSLSRTAKAGAYRAFPKGEFEFAARKNPETGKIETWGRKPVKD